MLHEKMRTENKRERGIEWMEGFSLVVQWLKISLAMQGPGLDPWLGS